MNQKSLTLLAAHVLHTLPEDLQEQKELLLAVYCVVNPKHPARPAITRALENVTRLMRDQESLKRNTELAQLKFKELLGGNTPAR